MLNTRRGTSQRNTTTYWCCRSTSHWYRIQLRKTDIKDAACNALSSFNLCDSTQDIKRELDQVTKQQKTQQPAFQTVQDQKNEKFTPLRDEVRLMQESVEQIKEDTYAHISYTLERIYTLEDQFRCSQLESAYRHFFQSSQLYLSQIGALYTHFDAFGAAFYAYRNNFFQLFHLLLLDTFHQISCFQYNSLSLSKSLTSGEFRKGSKKTSTTLFGFEAT